MPETATTSAPKPTVAERAQTALPICGLVLGLVIIAYYPATEALDAWRRAQVAQQVDAVAASASSEELEELFAQAQAYNEQLAGLTPSIASEDIWPYEQQLNLEGGNTAFGYVIIPDISLVMPIYHGTSDAVLSAGAGHLESSSLPVGGESTHAVITAHSGLSGMRAFDDLRLLEVGDVFGIKVAGQLICYEVTSIETVLPSEVDSLQIVAGEDLATLVTCTPYGVNTHRLLVHGTRCEVPDGFGEGMSLASQLFGNSRIWPFLAAMLVVIVVLAVLVARALRKRRKQVQGGGSLPS